ncbi:MAG: hypothetical protein JWL83_1670 [Actinomycetia bacterium]|nr:hypothetical protein [Actinomycetes bacterium]
MTSLPDKIVSIHHALDAADLAHAFGGALALAWCTERARGTIDIDVNVFVDVSRAAEVATAFPRGVTRIAADIATMEHDGQVRLWWDTTPVDVFLDTTEFHTQAGQRVRWESFGGFDMPFLSCSDLAVFKAFFNRTRDWADLEEMAAIGTLDVDRVIGVLTRYLGSDDERIDRLRRLT